MDRLRARRRPHGVESNVHRHDEELTKRARRYVRVRRHHLALLLAFTAIQAIALAYMVVHRTTASMSIRYDAPSVPLVKNAAQAKHYDIIVTIYTYNRPRHLLALLRDVARESDATSFSVGVNVLDDASMGCGGDVGAPDSNFFDSDPGANATATNTLHDVTGSHADSADYLSNSRCTARTRFAQVEALIRSRGWRLLCSRYRHGRRRYWHLISAAHGLLSSSPRASYYIFLPDDDRLCTGFFTRAIAAWESIDDMRKATLMLHVESTRETGAVWTSYRARKLTDTLWRIGWVESGNFLTTASMLESLNWTFPRVSPQRWIDNPPISSGVGAILSENIQSSGLRMYRTHQSLVAHVGIKSSQMNSAFRKRGFEALRTLRFVDGDARYDELIAHASTIHASMASVWTREPALHVAVQSLSHQVDHLNVYLNGYDAVPQFLLANSAWITVELGSGAGAGADGHGDLGDRGKFYWHPTDSDFHLTVDDDIIYPPDYAMRLVSYRMQMTSPAAIGVHGIRILGQKLDEGEGYYGSRRVYMATEHVPRRAFVHILGTGTLCYATSDVPPFQLNETFKLPNMADVWFGILAQKIKLPMIVIPHNESWLREVPGTFDDSIYVRSTKIRNADRMQTKAVKQAAPWKTYYP